MTRRLIVLLVLSLVILGCPAKDTPPPADTGSGQAAEEATTAGTVSEALLAQAKVVVLIDVLGGKPVANPDPAVVTHRGQQVEWITCDGELTITWKEPKLPTPQCVGKQCTMPGPPAGTAKGPHSYNIELIRGGTRYPYDPVIIIDY